VIVRTLFLLKTDRNGKGLFPSGQAITERIFIGAGWSDERALAIPDWNDKKSYFTDKAKYLFDPDAGHLPESVRLHETLDNVIFFGSVNKAEILVTKVNQAETFVRILHKELNQLQETTEIVVNKIKDKFKTVDDSAVSIAKDEVLVFERGHDHRIIKGTILHKGGLLKTLKTTKNQDKGNYYLLIVVLALLGLGVAFYWTSKSYFPGLIQFSERALLAFIAVSATPIARFIQVFLQLMSAKVIKWQPFSEAGL
jgi:hypothetical protein